MLHNAIQNALQNALRNAKGQGEDEGGFTLIELLVVILIIGILAAIALPTFLGQSNKAKDSSAKSDVRNAVTQMESCLADGAKTAATCATDPSVTQFKLLKTPVTVSGDSYTLTAISDTNNEFNISKSSGAPGSYTRTCKTIKEGAGCSAAATLTTSW